MLLHNLTMGTGRSAVRTERRYAAGAVWEREFEQPSKAQRDAICGE